MEITQRQLDRTALVLLVGDDGLTEWSSRYPRHQIVMTLRRIAGAIEAEYSPAPKDAPMLVRSFPGKPEQVRQAREMVRAFLNGMPCTDDAVLVVSELAANAVQHSLSRIGEFIVCVEVNQACIYVEVTDEGGPWFSPDLDAVPEEHPHGLEIVTRLSRDWGVDPVESGHRAVWAKVPIQAARPSEPDRRTGAGSPPVPLPRVSLFSPAAYLLGEGQ